LFSASASIRGQKILPESPVQFPCKNCGATLVFAPGTHSLKCQYCGVLNEIAQADARIEELDYAQQLLQLARTQPTAGSVVTHCDGCGAETTLDPGLSAGMCPFCGRAIVATQQTKQQIKPRGLLPFAIERRAARARFDAWLSSLWLAPGGLKRHADTAGLNGVYLPAWTYDCHATTDYTGHRGEHYWVSETYTATENGRSVTRTRQVRRTRWWPAAGRVENGFDDVLVLADRSLPDELRYNLQGWDLPALLPYQDEFISGFAAETYQIELPEGFEQAKQIMQGTIAATVRQDIGGDEQRIDSMHTEHTNITFKHILLPVWISAYRYQNRTFRFVINARTGAVFGQRPWSAWKVAGVALLAIVLILLIVVLFSNMRQ
jgi:predicted RNA-binding Zn-ribbon protein involved in translation (DUF1610 family)